MWSCVRDERPWPGPARPGACYRFTADAKGWHPTDHLKGFKGWMHADGHAGFNGVYRSEGVSAVACLALARRIAELCGVGKQAPRQPPDTRAMKRKAPGRRNFLTFGSKGGGTSAAVACTLIETAKPNGVDSHASLTDVLGRIADHRTPRIDGLRPRHHATERATGLPPIRQRGRSGRSRRGGQRRD